MSEKRKVFLLGAVVGTVIGAVAGLLVAPKPGKELRQDMKSNAQQVGEKAQQAAKVVSEHTTSWVEAAKEKVNDIRSWRQMKRQPEDEQLAQVSAESTKPIFVEEEREQFEDTAR